MQDIHSYSGTRLGLVAENQADQLAFPVCTGPAGIHHSFELHSCAGVPLKKEFWVNK